MTEMTPNRREFLGAAATVGGLPLIAMSATPCTAPFKAVTTARQDVRTRPNISSLSPTGPEIAAIRAGVRVMMSRPGNTPTSWGYQAAIHGNALAYYYWNQCKHGNWWFFPWHRLYLYYFERILSAASVEAGEGPVNLPYWNWDNSSIATRRTIPVAFRVPDSEVTNPLYRASRNASLNHPLLPALLPNWNPSWALDRPNFIQTSAAYGFGGRALGPLSTPQSGHGGFPHGAMEIAPHDYIHTDIGGLMGNPSTAGLDPLFWIHHANIDRLWKVWHRRDPGHVDPTGSSTWMNQTFLFHDETGNPVSKRVSESLDTEADLGYRYDDDPVVEHPPSPRPAPVPNAIAQVANDMPDHDMQEGKMLGTMIASAPSGGATLALEPSTISVPLGNQADAAIQRSTADNAGAIHLVVEDIRFDDQPGATYAVFLNLDDPAHPPCIDDPRFAGIISFFGLFPHAQAAVALDKDAPVPDPAKAPATTAGGGNYPLIVTDVVRTLRELNAWNPNALKVTFVRRKPVFPGDRPEPAAAEAPPKATIGSVSLRYLEPEAPG